MSYGATELDPGTGGDTVARDSITTLNGQAASPAGAVAQLIKPVFGPEGEATMVDADNPFPVHDHEAALVLLRLFNLLSSPPGYDPALQRQRGTVLVESGTVTTVGTVTAMTTLATLTNMAQLDGVQGRLLAYPVFGTVSADLPLAWTVFSSVGVPELLRVSLEPVYQFKHLVEPAYQFTEQVESAHPFKHQAEDAFEYEGEIAAGFPALSVDVKKPTTICSDC